jgi:hypothetical protein
MLQKYFDLWLRARPINATSVFLKVRFFTSDPTKLTCPLSKIGVNLYEDISKCKDKEKYPQTFLSRLPLACQAVNSSSIGWLFVLQKTQNLTYEYKVQPVGKNVGEGGQFLTVSETLL